MYEVLRNIKVGKPFKHVISTLEDPKTSLADLYEHGWWITDIFGTKAIIVHKTTKFSQTRPTFCCSTVHIDVTQITPEAARFIKKFSNQQWNKYKKRMLTYKTKNYRIYV